MHYRSTLPIVRRRAEVDANRDPGQAARETHHPFALLLLMVLKIEAVEVRE